jgi:8-oxo-dGTP diphosphatase
MSHETKFKLIASVYLVLEENGKTLLARRFQTGFEDGKYALVAGHVDGGETMREALAREVREEIGIELDVQTLKHVHTMHRWCGDHERVDLFFTAGTWKGDITNKEPEKCDDIQWFPKSDLPDNMVLYVKTALEHIDKGVVYSEFEWDQR